MAHDLVLAVHVAAGSVAHLALALVAFDVAALWWWLAALAVLASGLALIGRLAPTWRGRGWIRAYAHGQGGSYIAPATALLVVATAGPVMILASVAPTLGGLPLIERRVKRVSTNGQRRSRTP